MTQVAIQGWVCHIDIKHMRSVYTGKKYTVYFYNKSYA